MSKHTKQLELKQVNGWGGRRKGAGRPNRSGEVGHSKRVAVNFKAPLHITLRLRDDLPKLRNKTFLKEFKTAVHAARELGLRVVHYSILGNHIHLIVEAASNASLARGMKSLCGRLGKIIRKLAGGAGAVWRGRYHLHQLKTPTEVRRALNYVLLNFSKHDKLIEHLDEFSSGFGFRHWKQLLGRKRINGLLNEQLEVQSKSRANGLGLAPAMSWLLKVGWMRAPS